MSKRKRQHISGEAEDLELNMTPMIDVVFNLIIFFMLVTDLTKKELEPMTLPWAEAAQPDKGDEEDRVIVNVTKNIDNVSGAGIDDKLRNWNLRDGVKIHVKGVPYTLDTLKDVLFRHAERERETDHPANPAAVHLLVRADQDIPWREVQWVMQVAADPEVRIYKLQFATAKPKGE